MSAAHEQGLTLWLTGLSGAGKSTVGTAVAQELRAQGRRVEILDGDELRDALSPGLGFTREDRNTHVGRVGYLARLLARNGVVAVVPVIAPYADARRAVAEAHANDGTPYVEVFVSTGADECARRDVKGLYAAQAQGRISHLTGVDDPYEAPTDPDLVLDTTGTPLDASRDAVLNLLTTKGLR